MKKNLFLLLFLASSYLSAQVGIVELEHPVYEFLSRMKTMNLITNYDEFELPKTRKQVAEAINQLLQVRNKLNRIDNRILDELVNEFEYDLKYTSENYTRMLPGINYYKPYSDKEKFLYFLKDSSTFNLFVNLLVQNQFIYSRNVNQDARKVNLIRFGGKIRGTFLHNFGFMIQGTNGTYRGSKSLAQQFGSLRYNYKFNYDKLSAGGVDFYDETEGYLLADFDLLKFKIGRDRMNIGYGLAKTILGNNPPQFDYFLMNINYGVFGFSYFHGKLLGNSVVRYDDNEGTIRNITDKYLVYHRFSFDFNRHLKLGLGEMVVYSNRSYDLSYLNPFNYYKSVEHAGKDRDNSMLFMDVQNNSIKGMNLYATLLMDDLDFGKFGTSYYGNQYMLEIGGHLIPFYMSMPVQLDLNYVRVSPYTYSHRIYNNNFTNDGFALTDEILPNSESYYIALNSSFHHRASVDISFKYINHGANETSNGNLVRNYGGDYLAGHRVQDPVDAVFLEGKQEIVRRYGLKITSEPVKNYFIILNSIYEKSSFAGASKYENTLFSLIFEMRI